MATQSWYCTESTHYETRATEHIVNAIDLTVSKYNAFLSLNIVYIIACYSFEVIEIVLVVENHLTSLPKLMRESPDFQAFIWDG